MPPTSPWRASPRGASSATWPSPAAFPWRRTSARPGSSFRPRSTTPTRRRRSSLATSAIEALGVDTGCLHTEIKFTPDGPRIIEVNGRVGGGVPEMLERAAGHPSARVDPAGVARRGDADRRARWPPNASATASSCSRPLCRPRSRRSRGIDAVSDHPGVDTITVHQGPGADLDWKDGSRNHIMAVVGSAEDYTELQAVEPPAPQRGDGHVRRCEPLLVAVRLIAGRGDPATPGHSEVGAGGLDLRLCEQHARRRVRRDRAPVPRPARDGCGLRDDRSAPLRHGRRAPGRAGRGPDRRSSTRRWRPSVGTRPTCSS